MCKIYFIIALSETERSWVGRQWRGNCSPWEENTCWGDVCWYGSRLCIEILRICSKWNTIIAPIHNFEGFSAILGINRTDGHYECHIESQAESARARLSWSWNYDQKEIWRTDGEIWNWIRRYCQWCGFSDTRAISTQILNEIFWKLLAFDKASKSKITQWRNELYCTKNSKTTHNKIINSEKNLERKITGNDEENERENN